MVAVLWDCEGVALLDVMQRGTTNKTEAHTSKLKKKLRKLFHRVRPERNLGEMLLQNDQAS